MSNLRNTLMGTLAAAAIAATSGAALAQESQEHNGMPGKEPHTATQQPNKGQMGSAQAQPKRNMGQGATQEKPNRAAQSQPDKKVGQSGSEEKRGPTGSTQSSDMNRTNRPAATKNGAAQNQEGKTNATTAQGQDRGNLKGLQGNASGVNVQLNDQQKAQVRTTIIQGRNAPRVDHVNFDIAVGTAIPRGGVRIVPVPETLVRIEPSWRGFEYFVYEQEIVIVNPRDMTIVAVLVV
jgi:hypothetical protein